MHYEPLTQEHWIDLLRRSGLVALRICQYGTITYDLHLDSHSGSLSVKDVNPPLRAGESAGRSNGRLSRAIMTMEQYAALVSHQ